MALLAVGALVIGAAIGTIGAVVLAARGPDHPDAWDPRLATLVDFVEAQKGAPFEHPVHVDFLDAEAFDATLEVADTDLTPEELDGLADGAAMLRAFGLAEGDIDLLEAFNKVETGGTLAYYDSEADRVTIDGTDIDPAIATTVVHELTHAWQDQHYGLDRWDDLESAAEEEAFRAIVEGDATRVEEAYVATLSDDDLAAYDDSLDVAADGFDTDGVPPLILAEQAAPYVLGTPFLDVLVGSRADELVLDQVFDEPPTAGEHLLEPGAYLDDDVADPLDPPDVPGGADPLDEGTFGALTLYLVLADRLDPLDALAVADAWQGDAYVTGRDGDRVCTAWTLRFETAPSAAVDPVAVMADWAASLPDAEVVATGDDTIDLVACDPGPEASIDVVGRSEEVLGYPVIRLYLLAGLTAEGLDLRDGDDAELADCLVTAFLTGIAPEEMTDGGPDQRRADDLMETAVASCAG